jgi:uncharacterized membrane protein
MLRQKENEKLMITMEKTGKCEITGKVLPVIDLVGVGSIRPQIMKLIKEAYPAWNSERGMISLDILNKFRDQYVQKLLLEEKGDLNNLEKDVMDSISNRETLTINPVEEYDEKLTFGQRVADKMALFGGSWQFIIIFGIILFTWIGVNAFILVKKPFDPFPFILLNLILSCLAAIQAPVIMMSQNRQESKDRSRSQNDYQVNLKAEIEIRQLHEKIDHILINQGQRLFEIQQIQVELMEQLLKK